MRRRVGATSLFGQRTAAFSNLEKEQGLGNENNIAGINCSEISTKLEDSNNGAWMKEITNRFNKLPTLLLMSLLPRFHHTFSQRMRRYCGDTPRC